LEAVKKDWYALQYVEERFFHGTEVHIHNEIWSMEKRIKELEEQIED
jgi:hypothetical protein